MQPYDRREDIPSPRERPRPPTDEAAMESLKQENESLRQLIVQLSKLVIKKVAERH